MEGEAPTSARRSLRDRCLAIDWLVLDVDGVLTDGGIIYSDAGAELKQFHVRDGSGLKIWEHLGKRSAIITGRNSPIVETRAREVGVEVVIQGALDKMPAYRQLLRDRALKPKQVCFIGDDVPDLPILRNCGLAVAVADACPDVIAAADFVTRTGGGGGAAREVLEIILRAQGLWAKLLERFSEPKLADP
jgi:3-deoxy-D-manno-octulosonate 8-phosphate phosphatase (KDO 8-P phosphatase)